MHYFSLRNISVFSGMFLLLFGLTTWMLTSLPGSNNMACVVGAYLTTGNIFINLILSVVIALSVVNMVEFSGVRKRYVSKSGVIGTILAFLTSFCAACTLPILASLGIGGLFNFISLNHAAFQMLAICMCLYALYSSHKKVVSECKMCLQ